VNCRTDLWWLFYGVRETLTVIVTFVSNVNLISVSFAGLGLGLEGASLRLGTAGLDVAHY